MPDASCHYQLTAISVVRKGERLGNKKEAIEAQEWVAFGQPYDEEFEDRWVTPNLDAHQGLEATDPQCPALSSLAHVECLESKQLSTEIQCRCRLM